MEPKICTKCEATISDPHLAPDEGELCNGCAESFAPGQHDPAPRVERPTFCERCAAAAAMLAETLSGDERNAKGWIGIDVNVFGNSLDDVRSLPEDCGIQDWIDRSGHDRCGDQAIVEVRAIRVERVRIAAFAWRAATSEELAAHDAKREARARGI